MKNTYLELGNLGIEIGKVTLICSENEYFLRLALCEVYKATNTFYHELSPDAFGQDVTTVHEWENKIQSKILECCNKEYCLLRFPEAFLHPKYQVELIRIVLNSIKDTDKNIVIFTLSPYILEAVEVYSKKFGFDDFKAIMVEDDEDDVYVASDCTNNIDLIYKTFSEPFQLLEDVRSECTGE